MTAGSIRLLKAGLFLVCLLPLVKLAFETFGLFEMSLGANPVEELIHRLGISGLNFLLIQKNKKLKSPDTFSATSQKDV